MDTKKCPSCGGEMKRNGRNSSGTQRWRCRSCGASATHKHDNEAKQLAAFPKWLLGGSLQKDMPGAGRTFRRRCERLWELWPLPPICDEVHRVVYVDGIYLARNVVVLIACSDEHVVGWYLARSENSRAWRALMARIAPPDMVVTDGGPGFEKARRKEWPATKVQRCTFHAFCQVKRYTTSRPKLEAGVELYGLAKDLLHVETLKQAEDWVSAYLDWGRRWDEFLSEKTFGEDGRWEWTHERLVDARSSVNRLINKGVLFTSLDPDLTADGPLPSMNNRIEGGVNAPLRQMLRDHRGMSVTRRVKAVFWWCYMHTECPLPAAKILRVMPTDDDIDDIYRSMTEHEQRFDTIPRWGDAVVWGEFHKCDPWRYDWD